MSVLVLEMCPSQEPTPQGRLGCSRCRGDPSGVDNGTEAARGTRGRCWFSAQHTSAFAGDCGGAPRPLYATWGDKATIILVCAAHTRRVCAAAVRVC